MVYDNFKLAAAEYIVTCSVFVTAKFMALKYPETDCYFNHKEKDIIVLS